MTVTSETRSGSIRVPEGFRLAGVHCGIKRDSRQEDIALVVCDQPSTAAGVYTQNRIVASCVERSRKQTPTARVRAVVANSGNANACTGDRGRRDTETMAQLAATAAGAHPDQVLVMSTGIIGEPLEMEKIERGIGAAADQLGRDEVSLLAAARGLMTTDTVHKVAARDVAAGTHRIQITGLAKGAGMIGPRMATMLAIVMTDAILTPTEAQQMLSQAVEESFNCISVEGHTSTNDTLLLLASGESGAAPASSGHPHGFIDAFHDVCVELARSIPADGEGASHLIEIDVRGCASREEARQVARTVANSPLVKTAMAGADPNWGRIVSAVGYAGVECDPQSLELAINGTTLFRDGSPVRFEAAAVSQSIRDHRETKIELSLGDGAGRAKFWTSDLTAEYVRINADYHT